MGFGPYGHRSEPVLWVDLDRVRRSYVLIGGRDQRTNIGSKGDLFRTGKPITGLLLSPKEVGREGLLT